MEIERHWRRGRLIPALYDAAVRNERVVRPAGRLLWGTDVSRLFDAFAALGRLPPGRAVLDVPCGGGVAFRGLSPDVRLRYVAADLSPVMLARARSEAARRGLTIGFVQASIDRLPFPDGSFDLCVSFNGLHCFPDPAAALGEMARVVRPGGGLRGSAVVRGAGVRQDALIAVFRRAGLFGTVGDADDLRTWLTDAGLEEARVRTSGALAYFSARSPGGGRDEGEPAHGVVSRSL